MARVLNCAQHRRRHVDTLPAPFTRRSRGRRSQPPLRTAEGVFVGVGRISTRWKFEEEIGAFIWDANGDRRDMSKGQKAMLAALRPGGVRPLSGQTGVATGYIDKARQVLQWCDTATVEAVIDGSQSVHLHTLSIGNTRASSWLPTRVGVDPGARPTIQVWQVVRRPCCATESRWTSRLQSRHPGCWQRVGIASQR